MRGRGAGQMSCCKVQAAHTHRFSHLILSPVCLAVCPFGCYFFQRDNHRWCGQKRFLVYMCWSSSWMNDCIVLIWAGWLIAEAIQTLWCGGRTMAPYWHIECQMFTGGGMVVMQRFSWKGCVHVLCECHQCLGLHTAYGPEASARLSSPVVRSGFTHRNPLKRHLDCLRLLCIESPV